MTLQLCPFVLEQPLPDEMKGKGVGGQRIARHRVRGQTGFETGSILESERAEGGLRHDRYRAGGRHAERKLRVSRSSRLSTMTSSWNEAINCWLGINTGSLSEDTRKAAVGSTQPGDSV